jgi:hypothetical protein
MNKDEIKKMKPSAYKSMMLGKMGLSKSTPESEADLKRWVREKWQNLTPRILGDNTFYACGKQSKEQKEKGLPSVCRPSVKINDKTPSPLSKNLTITQIKKAVDIKKQGKRINWTSL